MCVCVCVCVCVRVCQGYTDRHTHTTYSIGLPMFLASKLSKSVSSKGLYTSSKLSVFVSSELLGESAVASSSSSTAHSRERKQEREGEQERERERQVVELYITNRRCIFHHQLHIYSM